MRKLFYALLLAAGLGGLAAQAPATAAPASAAPASVAQALHALAAAPGPVALEGAAPQAAGVETVQYYRRGGYRRYGYGYGYRPRFYNRRPYYRRYYRRY